AEQALQLGLISLRQLIEVRIERKDGSTERIETTVGRIKFNNVLPDEIEYINEEVNAGRIKDLVRNAIDRLDSDKTAEMIDAIKDIGFETATNSGLSVAVSDCTMIPEKDAIVLVANKKAEEVQESYLQGLITQEEKRRLTFEIWMKTTDEVADKTWDNMAVNNAIKVIIN